MPRGKFLNDVEKAKIDSFHEVGLSNVQIAKRIKRHKKTVRNYLKLKENYGKRVKNKGNTKLNQRQKLKIIKKLPSISCQLPK